MTLPSGGYVNITINNYIPPDTSTNYYGTTSSASIDDNVSTWLTMTNNSSVPIIYNYTNLYGSGGGTLAPGAYFSISPGNNYVATITWHT